MMLKLGESTEINLLPTDQLHKVGWVRSPLSSAIVEVRPLVSLVPSGVAQHRGRGVPTTNMYTVNLVLVI